MYSVSYICMYMYSWFNFPIVADVENNMTKILKLMKNEVQSKKEGIPKDARKESELAGLIEEFYTQYQSLYALYDRITGENGKIVTRRSLSSSGSESDYFSSDEVDGMNRRLSSESVFQSTYSLLDPTKQDPQENDNNDTSQALASSSNREKELQEQLNSVKEELKRLTQQNLELQLQVETKAAEADEVCGLKEKMDGNIAELNEKISTLTLEAMSLRTQKDEMEANAVKLRDQLNVMQQSVDSQSDKNKRLEGEIQHLNEQLVEEKEGFVAKAKDLKLELESRLKQRNELEENLREKDSEVKQMGIENKALKDRNIELKRAMTRLNGLAKERERNNRDGESMQAVGLAAEVNELRLELDGLREEKRMLELKNEEREKEYSESIAKIFDQGKLIKEQAESIEEAKMWSKKFKMNRQFTERRIEELAEETRKKLEDNIRILYQRIHVAEQMHNENKDSYKLAKRRYEEENRMLKDQIASFGLNVATPKLDMDIDINPTQVVKAMALADAKIEEQKVNLLTRLSKVMVEVEIARDWVKKSKGEMRELKEKVDDKEKQEVLLRDRVWELEAKVSKEGGEKLNLMKSVSQLEKKVARLDKSLKEKEEELINLGELKREAIRQLCVLNDYHRTRCDYLKDFVSKIRLTHRTVTRS